MSDSGLVPVAGEEPMPHGIDGSKSPLEFCGPAIEIVMSAEDGNASQHVRIESAIRLRIMGVFGHDDGVGEF